jgi:hypothetical protein
MKNKKFFAVGAHLSNGAILLHWKEERDTVVVIALYQNEIATWLLDASGDTYSGRYYKDLLTAVEDFKVRS